LETKGQLKIEHEMVLGSYKIRKINNPQPLHTNVAAIFEKIFFPVTAASLATSRELHIIASKSKVTPVLL
jgi:hypothetical protein